MVYHSFHQFSDFTDELTIVKLPCSFIIQQSFAWLSTRCASRATPKLIWIARNCHRRYSWIYCTLCNVYKRRVKKVYIILKNLQRDSFRGSNRQTHVFYNFGLYVLFILFLLVGLSLFEKSGSMKTDKHSELVRI